MIFDILKKEKKFLVFIFLFSFVLKALLFNFVLLKKDGYLVCSDSSEYINVANQIAQGEGICDKFGKPTLYRVPGYSIFLSTFFKLSNFDIKKILWIQILLSCFVPLLVFCLALILFNNSVFIAKLSSFTMALSLGEVLGSGLVMSDSLFLIFFLIFLILFFSSFDLFFCKKNYLISSSLTKFLFAGVFLGISSLIRPVGHFVLFISIVLLFLSSFTFLEKIKKSLLLFLGWFFVIFFWLVRSYLLVGSPVFHAMPGYHFLTYFAAEVECKNSGKSYGYVKNKLIKEWQESIVDKEKINELEKYNLAQNLALKYLKKDYFNTLKLAFVNMFKTLFSLNSSYLLYKYGSWPNYNSSTTVWDKLKRFLIPKSSNKFVVFSIYLEIIYLFFILFGFFASIICSFFDKKLFCQITKALPFIGLFIFLTLGSGVARLRLPVEPFLVIFSIYFYIFYFKYFVQRGFIYVRSLAIYKEKL